jgi:hypothetical protein
MTTTRPLDGALLLYHHYPVDNAPTIMEHVDAFTRHSRLPVFAVNTDRGFPRALSKLHFKVIVLHYSLFGGDYYLLPRRYLSYLDRERNATTIAFFQDEHRFCTRRFEFLDRYDVDAVYTLLDPDQHEAVYGAHTAVRDIRTTLTGYVGDDLVDLAKRRFVPDDDRTVDVGYRARQLAFFQGRGAQEKHEIGERFLEHARASALGSTLRLDIDASETSRIYGDAWYDFVASCRGMLGVEAGTSVFDLDDMARVRVDALLAAEPDLSFDEVERRLLHEYEGRVPYRTVSPRHFEAAAFRVAQILYRGRYSDVLEPDVHYLALEKDFSNFDDVLRRFCDPAARKRMTDRAYDDLIASGRWSYASFVHGLDEHLAEVGIGDSLTPGERETIERSLGRGAALGRAIAHPRLFARKLPFPGKQRARGAYRRMRQAREVR